jgi:hypothetical protein
VSHGADLGVDGVERSWAASCLASSGDNPISVRARNGELPIMHRDGVLVCSADFRVLPSGYWCGVLM